MALASAVALGGIGLTAGQANAFVVNVGGQNYDVTTFSGAYNPNSTFFETAANGGVMPWWGNASVADVFAAAVGSALGYPADNNFGSAQGPFFAYTSYFDIFQTQVPSIAYQQTSSTTQSTGLNCNNSYTFAQATLIPPSAAPAPGPLPALGAAAAFGFSRKLRKRIGRSTNPVSSTYSL
jgi:hypothetical protein